MFSMLFLWLHYPPREEQIARNIERVRRMPAGPIGEAKRSLSGWGHWPHLGTDRSDTRSPARPVAAGREQIARNIECVRWMPAGPIGEVKQSLSRVGPLAPPCGDQGCTPERERLAQSVAPCSGVGKRSAAALTTA